MTTSPGGFPSAWTEVTIEDQLLGENNEVLATRSRCLGRYWLEIRPDRRGSGFGLVWAQYKADGSHLSLSRASVKVTGRGAIPAGVQVSTYRSGKYLDGFETMADAIPALVLCLGRGVANWQKPYFLDGNDAFPAFEKLLYDLVADAATWSRSDVERIVAQLKAMGKGLAADVATKLEALRAAAG